MTPEEVCQIITAAATGSIRSSRTMTGGAISEVILVTTVSGSKLVLKSHPSVPDDLYECEARGLALLRESGVPVPTVLSVGTAHILLTWSGRRASADARDWRHLARTLAAMHSQTAPTFGLDYHNYAGTVPQINSRTVDGWAFFADHRLVNWLSVPRTMEVLSEEDRRGVERIASKLTELISPQPASLLHGDLWHANILSARRQPTVLIDPSVYFGWSLTDIAQLVTWSAPPAEFFDAYSEIRPLPDQYCEQLEVLALRDYLGMIANGFDPAKLLARTRGLLRRFV